VRAGGGGGGLGVLGRVQQVLLLQLHDARPARLKTARVSVGGQGEGVVLVVGQREHGVGRQTVGLLVLLQHEVALTLLLTETHTTSILTGIQGCAHFKVQSHYRSQVCIPG